MNIKHIGLYGRFFVLFTVTTILLVALLVLGIFSISEQKAKEIVLERHEQLNQMMLSSAVKPIDIKKLKKDAKDNRVQIAITNETETWYTTTPLPQYSDLLKNAEPLGSLYFAPKGMKYYLLANKGETWVVITSSIANLIVYPNAWVYWPWGAIILILFISYRLLLAQLKPIKLAILSAQQISHGNFDHKIKQHPKNDLAELTHGLDNMASELKKLFTAKDDLLLAVSHELRSPMARMKVSLALLEQNEIVHQLDNDINKMDRIIGQLLESERLQQPEKALMLDTYFLPNFITDVLTEHDDNARIELTNEAPDVALKIDSGRIKFVLRNLINNAIAHSNSEQSIQLTIDIDELNIKLLVIDQGCGIEQAFINDIFEPFTSNTAIENRNAKGLGLGLYLSKRIALAHNGDLTVMSEIDKGSTFTLMLPYCQ